NQETAGYIEGYEIYQDDDAIEGNADLNAYRDAKSFRLYSRMEKKVSDTHSLVITPYLRKTEMEFLQHFLPQTPLEENGQESAGLMLTWYDDSNANLQWIAGFDVEFTDGWLREFQEAPTQGPFPTGLHYDYQVDALQMAPFAQINWSPVERVKVSAGLRYEVMRYDYNNRMIAGKTRADGLPCMSNGNEIACRYSRPADRDDRFENLSPQAGVLYQLSDSHNLFANVSKGFRAPQTTELYRLQENQILADLESEEVLSYEVGARGSFNSLGYQLSLYAMT